MNPDDYKTYTQMVQQEQQTENRRPVYMINPQGRRVPVPMSGVNARIAAGYQLAADC